MSPIDYPVIPKGSTVLITGVNGFIGSNIADQFLKFGYKVRGTTRSVQKNAWLAALFNRKYGAGNFELVPLADIEADGAYDEVIKGVSAVIHTASNLSFSSNPDDVIPGVIKGTVDALAAAAKEPSVKRFVLTSSSTAVINPKANTPVTVTAETWNDAAVTAAYGEPPYTGYVVYSASKTLGEREAWKFVREKKPAFTLNTVLPNMNFGASLDPANQGHPSSSGLLAALFKGDSAPFSNHSAQYFIDVQDDALLHVVAAIHPGVESERIFGFAAPYNGDELLAILRKLYPSRSFPANFQDSKDLTEVVPHKRAEELLRDLGQDGWTSLEESVRRNTEDLL